MKLKTFCAVLASALLAACGGGGSSSSSDAGGGTTSATLSEDQKIYESVNLAPNAQYRIMGFSTAAAASSGYLAVSVSSMSKSPLTNGAQSLDSPLEVVPSTASVPATLNVVRYLVNGQIVASSAPKYKSVISYQGTGIATDTLSADGNVVVSKEVRSGYSYVPLTGLVKDAPAEIKESFNALISRAAALNATATWPADAGYIKFTSKTVGNAYQVFDGTPSTTTTDANVVPVSTGTTLEARLAAGINSVSDGKTYVAADGTISTVNGVKMFIAKDPRPSQTTKMYRIYFELNGNVYTGAYVPDGSIQGGPVRVVNGVAVYDSPTNFRFNRAAYNGLKAAFNF